MEGGEIGIVLSRASELRSKINNCIEKATMREKDEEGGEGFRSPIDEAVEVEDESESLLNIRDALESLEDQLVCLQALQQQQRYEREAYLSEIDQSRRILLEKLKEYKGEPLEVIDEASAFASETVEQSDDLLLPPYPSHPSHPLVSNNGFSNISCIPNFSSNGVISDDIITRAKKTLNEYEKKKAQPPKRDSPTGLILLFGKAAKTALTLVTVISVLSLAGFKPKLKNRSSQFNVLDRYQKPVTDERRPVIECPPGKVMVIEDGEPRCLVKERVEIPFESFVTTPDVSYGCG